MKKRKRIFLLLVLFLLFSLSFFPKDALSLGKLSFCFFKNLFEKEEIREVFGANEDAVAVFFDSEEADLL